MLPVLIISLGSALTILDLFIVNIAFSAIGASFPDVAPNALSLVVSGYSVAFAALLVPSGRLADRFGRRRVFRIGMALFALSSAACGSAPDFPWLVAGRVAQGAAAALLVPTSLGLLLQAYPPEHHGRMVGIWVASGSVAAALSPILGGYLVEVDWRWIFYVNLPIALPALALTRVLPESPRDSRGNFDVLGSGLLLGCITATVVAVSFGPEWGGGFPLWSTVAGGVLCFALFVVRCRTARNPALDLSLFRVQAFSLSVFGMLVFYAAFAMMLLGCSQFLTRVWGWSTEEVGLAFVLGPIAAVGSAVLAGRRRVTPRAMVLVGGLAFFGMGSWWLVGLAVSSGFLLAFLPAMGLSGIGAGMAQTGLLSSGAAALPPSEYATSSGVLNTCRQIGAAVGAPLFVAVSGPGREVADYRIAFGLMAVGGLVTAALSLGLSPVPHRPTPSEERDG